MDAIEKVRAVLESVKEPCFGHTLKELHVVRTGSSASGNGPSLEIRLGFPADASFIQALRKAVSQALDQAGLAAVDVPVRWEVLAHRVKLGLKPLEGVKNIIAVSSAKGGVGKSTVAVSLAFALSRLGARIGLLDADVYGPSVPLLLDVHGKPSETDDKRMIPVTAGPLQVNSIGFFVGESDSLAWRGPMASGVVRQLLEKTRWNRLDYLIVDMPPGTGDIPLTLVQSIPVTAALVVTTPQKLACADAARGLQLFEKVGIPVLGIVENMASFVCPECGHLHRLSASGQTEALAERFAVPIVASLPFTHKADDLTYEGGRIDDFDGQIDRAARFLAQAVSRMPKDMSGVMPGARVEGDVLPPKKAS